MAADRHLPSCVLLVTGADELSARVPDERLISDITVERFFAATGGGPAAAASLLTGVSSRVHRFGWEIPVFDYPGPTVADILRNTGYRTVAVSCDPRVSATTGFGRGFDDFVEAFGDDGIPNEAFSRIESELTRHRSGGPPVFVLWWQTSRAENILAHLARVRVSETTIVMALGLPKLQAEGRPDLVRAPLTIVPAADAAVVRACRGFLQPWDVMPTILALLRIEQDGSAVFPVQGRSMVVGEHRSSAEGRVVAVDQIPMEKLGLVWTVAKDRACSMWRLESCTPSRGSTKVSKWRRRMAAITMRPHLRQPMLEVIRHGRWEQLLPVESPDSAGSGDKVRDRVLARTMDQNVECWIEACDRLRRTAAERLAGGDDAALRNRLRGLGYLK